MPRSHHLTFFRINVLAALCLATPVMAQARPDAQTAARPLAKTRTAAAANGNAAAMICGGAVRVRVVRVLDPYQDPSNYESLTVKPGQPRSRFVLVVLEMQSLLVEPFQLNMGTNRLVDSAEGGTPEVEASGYGAQFGPRQHLIVEMKFNPLVSFGRPALVLLDASLSPPSNLAYGSTATAEQRKLYEDAARRLNRYPSQIAEIALGPVATVARPAAVKAQKEPKRKP